MSDVTQTKQICGNKIRAFEADMLTVNGYLGYDGIKPFADDVKAHDKGIFSQVFLHIYASRARRLSIIKPGITRVFVCADNSS